MKSKTKKVNPPQFKQWLSQMPKIEDGEDVPVNIEIRLSAWVWTILATAAHKHGWTIDETAEQILSRELPEIQHRDYRLEGEKVEVLK